MSLANALNLLRPTLPFYVALTKYGILHLDKQTFEYRPHPQGRKEAPLVESINRCFAS